MGKYFSLPDVLSLADSGDYGGNRALSADSAVIALCAGDWIGELSNWQGDSYYLTNDEIDTIQAMVATLQDEIITSCGSGCGVMEKLEEHIYTEATATIVFDDFGTDEYGRYELHVSGLSTDTEAGWDDPLKIEFNNVEGITAYCTLSSVASDSGVAVTSYRLTEPGLILHGVCGAKTAGIRTIGAFNLILYQPYASVFKRILTNGGIQSWVAGDQCVSNGSGWYRRTVPIVKIEIFPTLGTEFEVGGGTKPDLLVASLYGVE